MQSGRFVKPAVLIPMLAHMATNPAVPPPGSILRNSLYVGGVTLALCANSAEEIQFNSELLSFVDETRAADIEVAADFVPQLRPNVQAPSFDSGALWRAFSDAEKHVFDFTSDILGSDPYKRLIVDRTFTSARLLLNHALLAPHAPIFPLEYPTDELLITNHLASRGSGVEVHGCGMIDSIAGGELFLGHSGAGKSTTTRIWQSARNPVILSDDRIILRLENGALRMYGTPWHGEAAFAEQGTGALKRIFILQHGPLNKIKPLSKAQAVGEVFARSFPPFHSAAGLDGTLEFINRALDVVPCYEFNFVPDNTAVDTVLNFHD
jgi:hypothetical protein